MLPWVVTNLASMRYRFLIHELNHTILLVDITAIGLPSAIFPPGGNPQSLPSLRFHSWLPSEQHLLALGASEASLKATKDQLLTANVAVLTI